MVVPEVQGNSRILQVPEGQGGLKNDQVPEVQEIQEFWKFISLAFCIKTNVGHKIFEWKQGYDIFWV